MESGCSFHSGVRCCYHLESVFSLQGEGGVYLKIASQFLAAAVAVMLSITGKQFSPTACAREPHRFKKF
ncbi:hypothetical protein LJC08_02050 [Methanimicrococcus sp. OttesenSCG-928-J09]|nr:hypothetical protein [Methanimicrococcus sp. OttesenSCG-928-J09]